MTPSVDQQRSLVGAALDSAPCTVPDIDGVTEAEHDDPGPVPADTSAQMSLWDLPVPPPRAESAAPPGGPPSLTPPGEPASPLGGEPAQPLTTEPDRAGPAPGADGNSAFDPFRDTPRPGLTSLSVPPPPEPAIDEPEPEPEPEPSPEAIEIVARFDDLTAHDGFDEPWETPRVESLPRTVLFNEALTWVGTLPRWARRAAAATVATALVATALVAMATPPDGSDGVPATATPAPVVDTKVTRVARARLPLVDVFVNPDEPRVSATLEHPTPSGTPLVFVVEGEWADWYKVRVPSPPAGSTGWVRAGDVEVSQHQVRITVDLHDRLLTAREGGDIVLRAPIAVGRIDAPEAGLSFVTDRVSVSNPNGGYGTHALPLAGYENGQETFFRGQGLVAIHGTASPLSLGQTVAGGSVALANDDARLLYELAPLGTPVEVVDRAPDLAAGG